MYLSNISISQMWTFLHTMRGHYVSVAYIGWRFLSNTDMGSMVLNYILYCIFCFCQTDAISHFIFFLMFIHNMLNVKPCEFVQNIIWSPYKENIRAGHFITHTTHIYYPSNGLYQISAHINMHNLKQSVYNYSRYTFRGALCNFHNSIFLRHAQPPS